MTRPLVEPIAPPPLGGEPVVVPEHSHVVGGEAAIAVDLMERLGVDCGLLGFHSHRLVSLDEHTQVSQANAPAHHHHDLRCLVEAGANQVRPDLVRTTERLSIMTRSQEHFRRKSEDAERTVSELQATIRSLRADNRQMVAFMMAVAAKGPWRTVLDQFEDYRAEQREEVCPDAPNGEPHHMTPWGPEGTCCAYCGKDPYRPKAGLTHGTDLLKRRQ